MPALTDAKLPVNRRAAPPQHEPDVQAFADAELLGLLLGGGRTSPRSIELARRVLAEAGGLPALPGLSPLLLRHCGLRHSQALAILAVCEIASRLARQCIPDRDLLHRPEAVARFLRLRYQQRDQEIMGALFLDSRHRHLGDQEIYRGTLHRAAVEPREIFKQCLLRGAAGVAIFHTHPTGDPTPSAEDLLFTRRMAQAGEVLGIDLVDHLILGSTGRWVSLRQRGVW